MIDQHRSLLFILLSKTEETRNCLAESDTPDKLWHLQIVLKDLENDHVYSEHYHSHFSRSCVSHVDRFPLSSKKRDRPRLPKNTNERTKRTYERTDERSTKHRNARSARVQRIEIEKEIERTERLSPDCTAGVSLMGEHRLNPPNRSLGTLSLVP